jgi:hypothetical protein
VLGIERDLESDLYTSLEIGGPNGRQICEELVREPLNVAARREALQKQLDRLQRARIELLHVGV